MCLAIKSKRINEKRNCYRVYVVEQYAFSSNE